LLQAQDFNLIVLDLGLPDMDGLELLHSRKVPLPIMILTVHDGVNDKINGINQGVGGQDLCPETVLLRRV